MQNYGAYLESLWFRNLLFCRVTVEDVVVPFTWGASPDVSHCVSKLLHVVQVT